MDRCAQTLAETLKWEGGYSNVKEDPGGPTMHGVTQRVYDGYRRKQELPTRAVRLIERAEEVAIYRGSYWAAVRGDDLPAGVDLAVFDYGVNSGPGRAIMALQRAVGAKADGHLGEATLDAVLARDPRELVGKIMAGRRAFLRSLSTFPTFGVGWMNRCAGIEKAALGMADAHPAVVASVSTLAAPLPDVDVQSAEQGRAYEPETPATQHAEAHDALKQASAFYSANSMTIKGLGLSAAGAMAFLREHAFEIAVVALVAIAAFELMRYAQRANFMKKGS